MNPNRGSDRITPAALACVAASAAHLWHQPLWPLWAYALCAGMAMLGLLLGARLLKRWPGTGWMPVFFLVWGLVFALAGLRAVCHAERLLAPDLEGRDLSVVGVVSALPQRTEDSLRFRLSIESAHWQGQRVALPPEVLLGWYAGRWGHQDHANIPALRAGERWRMVVRLKQPHGQVNPHGFDFELWMWGQGLGATGYVRAGRHDPTPVRLGATWQYPVAQWRQWMRDRVQARIADPQWSGLINALLMGDQASIERADWDVFRATGVAHLVSISGLHVTLFAWLCGGLVRWAWRRTDRWGSSWCLWLPADQAARWAGLGLAVLYALFSGWGIPAQRTIWMLTWVTVLAATGRRWPWPQVWLTACAWVLLADPKALGQAGFWLSFVAVGVLFATGQGPPPTSMGVSWAQRLWRLWREQLAITLCLAPLSLWLFQQVSVVGLLANAVAIPWVTLWVTPLCLLGAFLPVAWDVAAVSLQALVAGLNILAAWPGAVWSTPAPAAWATAAATLGSLLLAMRLPGVLRAMGLPLMAPALLWSVPGPAPGEVEVWFPDIGQGHAVLVRTAQHALLFDAGPRYSRETDAGQRVLLPLLRAWGLRLDALVLSHSDSDHIGGAPAVLQMNPATPWWGSLPPSHPLHQWRRGQACLAGLGWDWDGVRFEFLHPWDASPSERAKPNTLSCVLKVQAQGGSVLLTGDIEAAQEKALIASEPAAGDGASRLRADVLLVPHHGSNTSSTAEFLAAVSPRWAWVQAGYRNRYGHPTAAVMARYQAQGVTVLESVRCGAGRWRSAQPDEVHCERWAHARYWHHQVP